MEFAEIRQPHPDWPWTLSEGGNLFRTFTWNNIEYDLAELYPDNDSFLILEQKDPADETRYWFIQSAIALKGPQKDFYLYNRQDAKAYRPIFQIHNNYIWSRQARL